MIKQAILQLYYPQYCMIDNLMNWCVNCSTSLKDILDVSVRLMTVLIDLLNQKNSVKWYLLDNIQEDYMSFPILMNV